MEITNKITFDLLFKIASILISKKIQDSSGILNNNIIEDAIEDLEDLSNIRLGEKIDLNLDFGLGYNLKTISIELKYELWLTNLNFSPISSISGFSRKPHVVKMGLIYFIN